MMRKVIAIMAACALVASCDTAPAVRGDGSFVVYVCMWDGSSAATLYEKVDKPASLADLYPVRFVSNGKGFWSFENEAAFSGIPDSEEAIEDREGLLIMRLSGKVPNPVGIAASQEIAVRFSFAELTFGGSFFQPTRFAIIQAIKASGRVSGQARVITMDYVKGDFSALVEVGP